MKVRIRVPISAQHGSYTPGQVVDWPDDDTAGLIAAGYATPVEAKARKARPAETAADPAPVETGAE